MCVNLEESDCRINRKGNNIRTKRELSQNQISKKRKRGEEQKEDKKLRRGNENNSSNTNNPPVIKEKILNVRMDNDCKVPKYLGKLFKNLHGVKIEIVEICSDDFVSRIQYFIKEDENLATSLKRVLSYRPEVTSISCDKKKSSIKITYVNDRESYRSDISNNQKCRNFTYSNVDNYDDQYMKSSSNDLKHLCGQTCKCVNSFGNSPESRHQESKKSKVTSNNNVNNTSDRMSIGEYSSGVDESGYENQYGGSSGNSISNEYLLGNEKNDYKIKNIYQNYEKLKNMNEKKPCNNPKRDNDDSDTNNNKSEDQDSDIDVEDLFQSEPIHNFTGIHAVNQFDHLKSDQEISEEYDFDNEHRTPPNLETHQNLKTSKVSRIHEENKHLVTNYNDLDHPPFNYHTNIDFDGEIIIEVSDSSSLKPELMTNDEYSSSKSRKRLKNNDAAVDNFETTKQHYNVPDHGNSSLSLLEKGDKFGEGIDDYTLDHNYQPKNKLKEYYNDELLDTFADEYLYGDDNATMDVDFENTEIDLNTRDKDIFAGQGYNDNDTSVNLTKPFLQEVTNTLSGDINNDEYQNSHQEANDDEEQLNTELNNCSGTDFFGEGENAVNKNDHSEYSITNGEANVNLDEQFNIEPNNMSSTEFLTKGDNAEYRNTNDETAIENLLGIDTAHINENSNSAQEYVNTEDLYTNEPGDISPTKSPSENYFKSHLLLTAKENEYLKGDVEGFEHFDSREREKLSRYNLEIENSDNDAGQNSNEGYNRKESGNELDDGDINVYVGKQSSKELNDANNLLNNGIIISNVLNDENIKLYSENEDLNILKDSYIKMYSGKENFDENIDDGINSGDLNDEYINLNNTNIFSDKHIEENNNLFREKEEMDEHKDEKKPCLNAINGENLNLYNGKDSVNAYNSQKGYLPYVNPEIRDGNGNLHNGNPFDHHTGNVNWQGVKTNGYANYPNEKINSESLHGDSDFYKRKESVNVINDRNVHGVKNSAHEINTNGYLYGSDNVGGHVYGTNNRYPIWYGDYNGMNANGINGGHGHFNGYNGGEGHMHGIYNQNGLYGHNGILGIPPPATGNPQGDINGYGNLYGVYGGKFGHYVHNGGNAYNYGAHNGNDKSLAGHSTNGDMKEVEMNSVKNIIPIQTTGNEAISTNSLPSPIINQHSNYINGNGQNYYHDRTHFSNDHPPNTYNGYVNGFNYPNNYQKHIIKTNNVFVTPNQNPNPIVYTPKYPHIIDNSKYQNQNDIFTKYQNQKDINNNYQHQNDHIGKYKSPNSDINHELALTESNAIVIPGINNPIKSKEKKHSLKIEINDKPYHVGQLPKNALTSLFKKTKDIIPTEVDEEEFEKYFKLRSLKKQEKAENVHQIKKSSTLESKNTKGNVDEKYF